MITAPTWSVGDTIRVKLAPGQHPAMPEGYDATGRVVFMHSGPADQPLTDAVKRYSGSEKYLSGSRLLTVIQRKNGSFVWIPEARYKNARKVS